MSCRRCRPERPPRRPSEPRPAQSGPGSPVGGVGGAGRGGRFHPPGARMPVVRRTGARAALARSAAIRSAITRSASAWSSGVGRATSRARIAELRLILLRPPSIRPRSAPSPSSPERRHRPAPGRGAPPRPRTAPSGVSARSSWPVRGAGPTVCSDGSPAAGGDGSSGPDGLRPVTVLASSQRPLAARGGRRAHCPPNRFQTCGVPAWVRGRPRLWPPTMTNGKGSTDPQHECVW